MHIRPLCPADFEAAFALRTETICAVNSYDYTREQIADWLASMSLESFVQSTPEMSYAALDGGKLVGFASAGRDNSFPSNVAVLTRLYTDRSHLGKGIGAALLNHTEAVAQGAGYHTMYLSATLTARRFYLKQGYQELGEGFLRLQSESLPIRRMQKRLIAQLPELCDEHSERLSVV